MPGVSMSKQFCRADKAFWNALVLPLEGTQPETSQPETEQAFSAQLLSFLARTEEEAVATLLNNDGSKSPRCLCTESLRELVNAKVLVVAKDAHEPSEVETEASETNVAATVEGTVPERSDHSARLQPKGMAKLAGVSLVGAADGMWLAAAAILL